MTGPELTLAVASRWWRRLPLIARLQHHAARKLKPPRIDAEEATRLIHEAAERIIRMYKGTP